jgi:hypothetical protein
MLLAALAALALSACATTPGGDDKRVVDRAQARWDAITGNELEAAYEYYSPGYRSANSLIDFGTAIRLRKVNYTNAEYLDHQCEQNRCTVRFMVGYRVFAPVPGMTRYDGKQVVEDTWVKTSGEWWYLPDK